MSKNTDMVRSSGELALLANASDKEEPNGDLCGWAWSWLTTLCKEIEFLELALTEVRKVCNEQEKQLQESSKKLSEIIIDDMRRNPKDFLP